MLAFKIVLLGLLHFFTSALEPKCPQDTSSKLVVCYYKGEIPLKNFNICNCTHIIFTNAVRRTENNISANEDTIKYLEIINEKKENLSAIFTLETKHDESSKILKSRSRSEQLINGIIEFLQESQFDGVELNFRFSSDDSVVKESYSSFVKNLSKVLSRHKRVKRNGYDVFEKLQDDVTTVAYTTQSPKNSTSETQSIKRRNRTSKENRRKIREKKDEDEGETDYLTLEEAINTEFSGEILKKPNTLKDVEVNFSAERKFLVFVRLSIKPEIIAKKYDLKDLSRYADILTIPTHHIANSDEDRLTYHPSRLMGLSDIQNTDSILDFLTGMGALKSKMVITLPATVLKFQLTDENKNTPRSPSGSKPQVIDQSQLCALFSKSNWTVERDDDLTAPYAFSGKTWLAFEDGISVNIKGKYILLRELAGGAIFTIDFDLNDDGLCSNHNGSGGYLTGVLHKNFESLGRKPRALVLESLEEEIHDTSLTNIEAGVKLSEYRIVRIVDHSGAVHVIRKNAKTQFECSRQGFFSHPLGCNKFYRCVKFDQYSDEFTVFEYNCPAGLAFDERWEVCVWPGSLPHGAPCTGSSEIAPVPRSHYQCPNQEGFYADPENCRWFFACLDHARDQITPLTAYEFRCPFGLVFNEQRLACDWPWLVGTCGNRGAAGYLNIYSAGQSQGIHTATFINGGNLEASFGQYGNTDQENSFATFGKKFGSVLKGTNTYNEQASYQGAQSAGFGYIASQFDDNSNRASFATFPDYEISGGRIFSKGGVVLNQNIVGFSNAAAGGVVEGLGALNIRENVEGGSRSLGEAAKYFGQGTVRSDAGSQDTSNLNFQKVETSNANILRPNIRPHTTSSILAVPGEQVPLQNSVQTPKHFSVSIPSVQINSEKISKYSQYSTIRPTTPQTLLLQETPLTDNINVQISKTKLSNKSQYSYSNGFTVTQLPESVGISVTTPTSETLNLGGVAPESFDSAQAKAGVSLSTPTVFFDSTPRTELYRLGQSNLKENKVPSRIFVNQAAVTTGVSAITSSRGSEIVNESASVFVPLPTPKPSVHNIEYTARDSISNQPLASTESAYVSIPQQNQKTTDESIRGKASENSADILAKVPVVQANIFTNVVDRQNLNSKNVAVKESEISYRGPLITLTPEVAIGGAKTGFESGREPTVSSSPASASFAHSSIDEKISNELRFNQPQSFYTAHTATPTTEFQSVSKTDCNDYFGRLNVVTNKAPVVTSKPDIQILSQDELNINGVTSQTVSAGTTQPDSNLVKFYSGQTRHAGITPIVQFKSPEVIGTIENNVGQVGTAEVAKDFSKASYSIPVTIKQSNINNFEQASSLLQKGISQGEKSYSVPDINSKKKTHVSVEGFSQVFAKQASDITFLPAAKPIQPIQPIFGQRYSSFKQAENQFEIVSSTPKPKAVILGQKIQQPNTLTEVTVEQQPIVSIGTISSTDIDQTISTPIPHSFTQDVLSQSHPSQNFNFISSYSQPQPTAVSDPPLIVLPGVSKNNAEKLPQSPDVNFISKSPQIYKKQERLNFESFIPAHQQTIHSVPFSSQKSNFNEEVKSFSPASDLTTPIPFTYEQEITSSEGANSAFYGKSNVYLPSSTPKPEISGPLIHQDSPTSLLHFEKNDKNQILIRQGQPASLLNQQFEILKEKPLFEEIRTEYQQPPIQPVPENRNHVKIEQSFSPFVTTIKPIAARQELVGVQVSKSIEINPSQIFQSTDGVSQNLPAKTFEIQPKPIQLISQRTFSNKKVIQPFYPQKEQEGVHTQINIPENRYQEQFVLQEQINLETPKTEILKQKQYLPPSVASKPQISSVRFTTPNNINTQQPVVYFEGSVNVASGIRVFEASRIPLTGQKETTILRANASSYQPSDDSAKTSSKTLFVEQFDSPKLPEVVSSKVNLLIPTSTETPKFTVSKTDELSIQSQNTFDSQKINAFGEIPGQIDFIRSGNQATLKSAINDFETPVYSFQFHKAQNFTSGSGRSEIGSGVKYVINPNIEIPEPPREYILAQNGFTTVAPELATSVFQFTSQAESEGRFKGSTYPPPHVTSQKHLLKTASRISTGNVNEEELHGYNIQQLFDKYSGRFGEVINGKNGKFVTGNGEENIGTNREASSTIQYEVSSTTPRPNIRGRQYLGGITSGVQATNKYEEYEINGGKNSQKSFETLNANDGAAGISKTTLDLKNLKLNKNKKTVIVVSQISDANPVLIGKLAGQCSCQSNTLELKSKKSKNSLRRKNSQNQQSQATVINEYLPPFAGSQANIALETLPQGENPTSNLEAVVISSSKPFGRGISYTTEQSFTPSFTTVQPKLASSTILSSLGPDGVLSITPKAVYAKERAKNKKKQFRGSARYLQPFPSPSEDGSSIPLLSPVPASEIANKFDYSVLSVDESRTQNEIDKGRGVGVSKVSAGAAFDRYGPGGWRGFDETLQGSIDCKRPGLFRHPKYCNKFYACNYDPWKERYTLHIFNCPIHLTYDSSISACNWPVRGPACADDNLLV